MRRQLFEARGGRAALLARAAASIERVRPWTVDWLQVQKNAFGLREVFGDADDDLCRHLQASMEAGASSCLLLFSVVFSVF